MCTESYTCLCGSTGGKYTRDCARGSRRPLAIVRGNKVLVQMCTERKYTRNPARSFTYTVAARQAESPSRGGGGLSWRQWLSSCSKRPAAMGGVSTRVPFCYLIRPDCRHCISFSAPPTLSVGAPEAFKHPPHWAWLSVPWHSLLLMSQEPGCSGPNKRSC